MTWMTEEEFMVRWHDVNPRTKEKYEQFAARATFEVSINPFNEKRSLKVPPKSIKKALGMAAVINTKPSVNEEPVN